MNQDEINDREHANPANWSWPLGFYHSDADSRVWVPKQQAWMGFTLNMAKPAGRIIAALFLVGLLSLAVMILALAAMALQPR